MTKGLAAEWAPDIRVNAFASGYVSTEFTKGDRGNEDSLETIPVDRFAEPGRSRTSPSTSRATPPTSQGTFTSPTVEWQHSERVTLEHRRHYP
ncbi:hypothetical protein GCM10008985_16200 [Halococcus dombrowskii]|uniref:Uncharacterized protein n=1 Tax=Halococcus dombrowskii TaxID=179637 RepID=A0AAV3SG36_HALDO